MTNLSESNLEGYRSLYPTTNLSESDLEGYFVAEWVKYVTEDEEAFSEWWATQHEDATLLAD
jgi:hypothetical protein